MTKKFQNFSETFGTPYPGSAVGLRELGLQTSDALKCFINPDLHGLFHHGLLSIASVREQSGDLGPWAQFVPHGTRLFASSAFGFLFTTSGSDLWVIDPIAGQVVESDIPLEELPDLLCDADVRHDFLKESLFQDWYSLNKMDLLNYWLCPTPVPAFGGSWSLNSLRKIDPIFFLSFTAQIFDPNGPNSISIRQLPDS